MAAYIVRRMLILIPMLLVISFLIYLGLALTPGDPVSYMLGPEAVANLTPEQALDVAAYVDGQPRPHFTPAKPATATDAPEAPQGK